METPPQVPSRPQDTPNPASLQNREEIVEEVNADEFDQQRPAVDAGFVKVEAKPYDPRPYEDKARRNIAYLLIALLIGICTASFVLVITWAGTLDRVVQLLQIILSPVVALVSAATGFYYGTKSKEG